MENILTNIQVGEVWPWAVGVGVCLAFTVLFYFVRKFIDVDDSKVPKIDGLVDTEALKKTSETKQPEVKIDPKTRHIELKEALQNTRKSFIGRIKNAFLDDNLSTDDEFEALEEVLYTSDIGPQTVQRLMLGLAEKLPEREKGDFEKVRDALRDEMLDIFSKSQPKDTRIDQLKLFDAVKDNKPTVWMVVGVNGAGKTTTIGKLAHMASKLNLKTMVIAGDTFRAAAGGQLQVWSERANVDIFSPDGVKDPSAVAFDGCQKALANDYDLVIVDTAGRLHTQENLMEELKKMKRVIQKILPEAPHETLIVLDSNSGQNALVQVEKFNESLKLSGAILTKLDGSAKGGVALGLACQYEIPIKVIGVGEGIDDLRPFQAKEFVDSIL